MFSDYKSDNTPHILHSLYFTTTFTVMIATNAALKTLLPHETKWAQPCFNIGSSSQIVCEPKLATAFFTLSAEKCNICTKNLYRLGCVILHVPWWLIASSEHSVKQFWVLRCTSRCVWRLCRPWSWTWTGTGWRCGLRPPSRSPSLRARSSWTSAWSRCPWKRTTPGWGSCSLPP